jgi:hypothetical protein
MTRLAYRTLVSDENDRYDPWGSTMENLFLIAAVRDVLDDVIMPGYKPGIGVLDHEGIGMDFSNGYHVLELIESGELTSQDLVDAYRVLDRYSRLLERHGKSY